MNILCIALVGYRTNYILYNTEEKKIRYFSAEQYFDVKKATMSVEQIIVKATKIFKNIDMLIISACDLGEAFLKKNEIYKEYKNIFHENYNLKNAKTFFIDHHYAHVLSSFCLNKNINNGIAIDAAGSYGRRISIFKNIKDIKNTELILKEEDKAIGAFFNSLSKASGVGQIGKLMGLQSYGDLDNKLYKKLEKIGIKNEIVFSYFLRSVLNNTDLSEKGNFDKIYTCHKFAIDKAFQIFEKYFDKNEQIAFGGGCGLSIPLNSLLLDNGYNITVCPATNDSGISIGCLKFADMLFDLNIDFSKIVFSNNMFDAGKISDENIKKAAELLANNEIIGWCQGNAEVGPRALGHRSFLMNPSIKNGKNFINEQIKHREWWRPFGGTIIDTSVLENYKPSNLDYYMLRTFSFRDSCKEKFQSIIHIDNTTRLQILEDKNDSFYKLINEFYKITGIPGLLNTSYNLGGKPMANSKNTILNTYNKIDNLKYLFFGDNFFIKGNTK